MNEATKLSEKYTVKDSDTDMHGRLKTSRLFELLQDISTEHVDKLGFGRSFTDSRSIFWAVTRQKADIRRMPKAGESVLLTTWPGKTRHMMFPRFYRIEDSDDNELIRASFIWVLMDKKSRSLVFPQKAGLSFSPECEEEFPFPAAVSLLPERSRSSYTAAYSVIDRNGHMNNTRYFDAAEDLLPDAAAGKALSAVNMEYVLELRYAETMEIALGNDGGTSTLSAEKDGKCIFRMKLSYGEDA